MDKDVAVSTLILRTLPPLTRFFRKEVRAVSLNTNVTFSQFRVLAVVRHGTNRVGKIAVHHGVSQPAMSKIVDGVVKKGWLKRVPHPKDRRQAELILTSKGKLLVHDVEKGVSLRIASCLSKLPAADQRIVALGITKMLSALKDA